MCKSIDTENILHAFPLFCVINRRDSMDNEIILTKDEAIDLLSCVNCFLKECFDCQRNETKQKLMNAVIGNARK